VGAYQDGSGDAEIEHEQGEAERKAHEDDTLIDLPQCTAVTTQEERITTTALCAHARARTQHTPYPSTAATSRAQARNVPVTTTITVSPQTERERERE
jgi:hypothetical protein